MIDTKENSQSIEKETRKNDIIKPYQIILENDEVNKQFSYEELQSLCKGIDTTQILLYGQQALIWLLKDFTKDDIDSNLLIYEINELEKHQLENQRNDLRKLKNEIINTNASEIQTNTSEIQTKIDNLRNNYQNIDIHFKPNLESSEWTNFTYEKQEDINLIHILNENNIDPNFYFQIRYTAEQLIQSQEQITPENIAFINQFNTLNKSLNIDYQINIPTEKMQFADKPKNLSDVIASPTTVLAYPSVREYTSKQPNHINRLNTFIF